MAEAEVLNIDLVRFRRMAEQTHPDILRDNIGILDEARNSAAERYNTAKDKRQESIKRVAESIGLGALLTTIACIELEGWDPAFNTGGLTKYAAVIGATATGVIGYLERRKTIAYTASQNQKATDYIQLEEIYQTAYARASQIGLELPPA